MIKGDRIKKLRESKGLTQQDFAEKLGVNRSMVAKYEAGAVMSIPTLMTICKLLDTNPNYLLGVSDVNRVALPSDGDATLERNLLTILSDQINSLKEKLTERENEVKRLKASKKVH